MLAEMRTSFAIHRINANELYKCSHECTRILQNSCAQILRNLAKMRTNFAKSATPRTRKDRARWHRPRRSSCAALAPGVRLQLDGRPSIALCRENFRASDSNSARRLVHRCNINSLESKIKTRPTSQPAAHSPKPTAHSPKW